MHLAIGHYSIGAHDGVNTVMWRTINRLCQIDPTLHITLFGKATDHIEAFLPWRQGRLEYCNVEEMSPDYAIPGLEDKTIKIQQVHDYIWHGTNVAGRLQQRFRDANVVLIENLSVGINPSITYAFYLWSRREYQQGTSKRFLVRVHDFAQQRPANFQNIKKFQAYLPADMPDWHQILYPATPNVEYIAINTTDYFRLLDHGIEARHVWYVPNSIDPSLCHKDDGQGPLRELLNRKKGIDPHASLLFYPVRAIPRKNVEEAFFLLKMLNILAADPEYQQKYHLDTTFHLVVSLEGSSPQEKAYTQRLRDYARDHQLPVTIDISDLVALHRQYHPDHPDRLLKYGVADMYAAARMTLTTSVMEGFGFVFIEPWAACVGVIGRNLPAVSMDFKKAGLCLDHLYNVLLVNGEDFADLGADDPDAGLERRLAEIKKLDDSEYLRMILQKNGAPLRATLKMFRPERRQSVTQNIVQSNRRKVLDNYATPAVVDQLHRIILAQEPTYLSPRHTRQISETLPANAYDTD